MNQEKVNYICVKMLEVEWQPKLTDETMSLLDSCDSLLEIMYLFGAIFFLENICAKAGNMSVGEWPIEVGKVSHFGKEVNGYKFWGIWPLWYHELGEDCGPQSIMFVPQTEFGDDYHHDFGIFYGDKYGSDENWELKYGVEIDGYAVHKLRRDNVAEPVPWTQVWLTQPDDFLANHGGFPRAL